MAVTQADVEHALRGVIDPNTGRVLADVGGFSFAQSQFDRAIQARRQPGSAFKPFVYGAAFVMGMSPEMTFIDEPVTIRLPGGGVWQPEDVSPPSYAPDAFSSSYRGS